ncbi:hypothetical protein ACQPYK_26055 [Streptosporangium sp. CA-135522]|uniref:hypothetical protein n=1 Tax=Streptosporangium sp. CA-135522 TaxID=3240072 RepID=UPI003D8D118F
MSERVGAAHERRVLLWQERAAALRAAVRSGPPPLGPGARPAERIVTFLQALSQLGDGRPPVARECEDEHEAGDRHADPEYALWHDHLSGLIALARPDLDAGFAAHALLAVFDADTAGLPADADPGRRARSLRELVGELLS